MPQLDVVRLDDVGQHTVAIEVTSPPGFEAYPGQFVLVRATIDGEEETGYYTISSPDVDGSFEMTVAVDPDGTLGPWLADRTPGDAITVEGPFGDITYTGEGDAVVFAGGPGIGPAVGIAEHACETDHRCTIVFDGERPAHAQRLDELQTRGASVILADDIRAAVESVDLSNATAYVFGFQGFIDEAKAALDAATVDLDAVEFESFGPE